MVISQLQESGQLCSRDRPATPMDELKTSYSSRTVSVEVAEVLQVLGHGEQPSIVQVAPTEYLAFDEMQKPRTSPLEEREQHATQVGP